MSKISDVADKVQANFDKLSGDLDEINKEIQAQNTRIQDLQNSPGTLDPVDEARLDVIASKSAELAAKADALVIPPVPAAPSP